jgi:hypothetical protein
MSNSFRPGEAQRDWICCKIFTQDFIHMSPQPSRTGKLLNEVVGDNLVFVANEQSSLTISTVPMTQLWAQARAAKARLAHGGLEIGGLLVGPRFHGGGVVVTEIVPLPIEYRYGPSFRMSGPDLAAIAPAIESVERDPSKAVLGFYRSRTRGDETLRSSDHEILAAIQQAHASFADDFLYCLVLAPKSQLEAIACVAMRTETGWEEMPAFLWRSDPLFIIPSHQPGPSQPAPSHSSLSHPSGALPFPRHSRSHEPRSQEPIFHTHGPVAVERHIPVDLPIAVELPLQEPAQPMDRPQSKAGGGFLRAAIGVLVGAGLVGGAGMWVLKRQPQTLLSVRTEPAAARTHLGFSATEDGKVWKLSWDRAAMDALNPVGAQLSIEDGGYRTDIALTPPDLASGVMFYTPNTADLTFALRVDRGGPASVEEHVRVLKGPVVAANAANQFYQPAAGQATASVRPAAAPAAVSPAQSSPVPPAAQPVSLAVTKTETSTQADANREVRFFQAPPRRPSAAAPTAIPEPPSELASIGPSVRPPAGVLALLVPPPAAPGRGSVAPPATPPAAPPARPASPSGTTVPPAPAPVPTPHLSNYVGPKPTQQVRPQTPPNSPEGARVQVTVDIDAHGRVTKVTPVGLDSINAPLMNAAAHAAAFWLFEPARLNGTAVASQMNLIFRF